MDKPGPLAPFVAPSADPLDRRFLAFEKRDVSAVQSDRHDDAERKIREATFKVQFERELPDFARMCNAAIDVVILHQGAFAADYQESEFCLLGRAIKYAGLLGKEIQIVGASTS